MAALKVAGKTIGQLGSYLVILVPSQVGIAERADEKAE
jgi:hypothetical protein